MIPSRNSQRNVLLLFAFWLLAGAGNGQAPPKPEESPTLRRYKPGELTEAERKKIHDELMKKVRAERKGDPKAATRKQKERMAELESKHGIYDVATILNNGDVSNRLDIVIVSAGYPKSAAASVNAKAEALKTALLKVDPFRNYAGYINFHRVSVDDAGVKSSRIPLKIDGNLLSSDTKVARTYADHAPDRELAVVLANATNVRANGAPVARVVTIDDKLDVGRTFLHETGHAFAALMDEYENASDIPRHPLDEIKDELAVRNVTQVGDPKRVKWHYWIPAVWAAPYQPNVLPKGRKVGCFVGGHYRSQGVWRPEAECLMRHGYEYCTVCFEEVEKQFYRFIAPIDAVRPRRLVLGLWSDESITLEADAISTAGSGGQKIGKFEGFWYVDGKPRKPSKLQALTTGLTLRGSELGKGVHEAGLRVDFSNVRVRRDDGWLSGSAAWTIDVSPSPRPKIEAPADAKGEVGKPVTFDVRIAGDAAFKLEARDLPDGAKFTDGKFSWTPDKAGQGGWRPRFVLVDGPRTVEKAVPVIVTDPADKGSYPPVIATAEPVSVEEGEKLEFAIEATDVDGDHLVFTASNLPEGAELGAHDGVLRWTPESTQAGKYEIPVEATDGRNRSKGTLSVIVEDRPAMGGPGFAVLQELRSRVPVTRAKALDKLKTYNKTFQYLESSRMLRDLYPEVRGKAFAMLKEQEAGADDVFRAMMVKDLAPHVWHFTDAPDVLKWIEALVAKGKGDAKDLQLLKTSLQGAAKYNQDRGM